MENIIVYVVLGVICVAALIFLIVNVIKFSKMSKEEKKELLITYLKGLVAYAEKQLGSGKGAEKLKLVEDAFNKKAPFIYKLLLKAVGAKDLKDLIETALAEVKRDFVK